MNWRAKAAGLMNRHALAGELAGWRAKLGDLAATIPAQFRYRGRLRPKFVLVFTTVVCVALISTAAFEVLFSFQDRKAALIRIQHEQAEAAAGEIAEFMKNIEDQLAWTTHAPWTTATPDQQSLDLWRMMLRQVPAITDLSLIDASGREVLRVSRLSLDEIGSRMDYSKDPKFFEVSPSRPYRSAVYFRGGSEPYMTISVRARNASVSVAEVNLKFIWDVVSRIKVGEHGQAYVVDGRGRLIAHPDISLVLRNIDLSGLPQVEAARTDTEGAPETQLARDIYGRKVLTANAAIAPLDWTMFVELPLDEAYAPLYTLILRVSILILLGLLLAFIADLFLVRWIVQPLEQLEKVVSTVRRTKDYSLRVDHKSNDEIGRLAAGFNDMLSELSAARERESADQLELARVSRLTTMGAMTASIAHEINQPLAAIAANANAGLRWLARASPDIEEVHAALKRINTDAHRAGEIIQSVRSIFKKAPQQGALVDVNAIIQEVLGAGARRPDRPSGHGEDGPRSRPLTRPRRPRPAPAGHPQPYHQRGRGDGHGRGPAAAPHRRDTASRGRGRADPRAGQRPRHRSRRQGAHLRRVLFHEIERNGHGPVHLPLDRRSAWRTPLGDLRRIRRRSLQPRPAGRPARRRRGRGLVSSASVRLRGVAASN